MALSKQDVRALGKGCGNIPQFDHFRDIPISESAGFDTGNFIEVNGGSFRRLDEVKRDGSRETVFQKNFRDAPVTNPAA